jgi:hypothetical protein
MGDDGLTGSQPRLLRVRFAVATVALVMYVSGAALEIRFQRIRRRFRFSLRRLPNLLRFGPRSPQWPPQRTDHRHAGPGSGPDAGAQPAGSDGRPEERLVKPIGALPRELAGEGDLFVFRVGCDSMSGAGIFGGDWAVAREQSSARDGDLVAADIDGVTRVGTYQASGGRITFSPHNGAHMPTLAGDEKAGIRGRVIAVLRAGHPAA